MNKRLLLLLLSIVSFISINAQIEFGQEILGEFSGDKFGRTTSISSDGSIIAVGAFGNDSNGNESGHVRVFKYLSGTWMQIGQNINGEAPNDRSGVDIDLSADGSIIAIGAGWNDGNGEDSGHVRIYKNISNTWTQIGQDIDGEFAGDESGRSVSLSFDGNILAIGALKNDGNGNNHGHVRIYQFISNTWTQIGQDIDGEGTGISGDFSGTSIDLSSDGTIVAIGANGNYQNGHVRVYKNVSNTWTQIGQDIDGEGTYDNFGYSVSLSLDGSILAAGGIQNSDNGLYSGHVRVYQSISNTWTQIGQDIDGEAPDDRLGIDVDLSADGNILAIGAGQNNVNKPGYGYVKIYKNISNTWTHVGEKISGEAIGDYLGHSVGLSSNGNVLITGAMNTDGNGISSGHAQAYNLDNILSANNNTYSKFHLVTNPIKDVAKIKSNSRIIKLEIYNNMGQTILTEYHKPSINISSLTTGLYFLRIIDVMGNLESKKIIKK